MKSQVKGKISIRRKGEPINYDLDANGKKRQSLKLYSPRVGKYATALQGLKEGQEFPFTKVFSEEANQDDIFEGVAKGVVLNCLDGFNGTIFAYGQTGSGKTYTMSGADSWQLRGIIPRVLSCVFDETEARSSAIDYKLYVSYLEIYNEQCYDLLDKDHLDLPLEEWSKVSMFQDDDGNVHLKGLSVHNCQTEQQGVDLLMMGNFIRQVSSTPMNMCSSRSHCVFILIIEGKNKQDGSTFVSKLHLVDLAGSERISKGHIEGNLATETKYINLSLTYLEQVIIALKSLQQGKRMHVPYRNSAMTTLLKDSLGGNCKTSLIACLSSDCENFEETISTCRFAHRCGQLENLVKKNETLDLASQLKKLKQENATLMKEIDSLKKKPAMDANMARHEREGHNFGPQNSNSKSSQVPSLPQSSPYMQVVSTEDITPELIRTLKPKVDKALPQIEDYLKEKIDYLDCQNLFEAHVCLEIIKQLYNSKMKEYIKELGVISNKLRYYDEYIAKKYTPSNFRIGVQQYMEDDKTIKGDKERRDRDR